MRDVANNCMGQRITIILFLLTSSLTARGQVRTVGKVYVDGRELEIIAHGPPYFEFNPFDTTLTKSTMQYLDDFGKYYKDSLFHDHKYVIELTPGLTIEEREKDKDLGIKRIVAVMDYLKRQHGIERNEFKARYSETITTDGCVAYLVKEKNPKKLTRKKKRKLKIEEDEYFREQ
jgi:hypothetical protein